MYVVVGPPVHWSLGSQTRGYREIHSKYTYQRVTVKRFVEYSNHKRAPKDGVGHVSYQAVVSGGIPTQASVESNDRIFDKPEGKIQGISVNKKVLIVRSIGNQIFKPRVFSKDLQGKIRLDWRRQGRPQQLVSNRL